MTDRPLPNGWRISEPYTESKQWDYVKRVSEELSAVPRQKKQVPNTWNGKPIELLTQAEREEFYFSMQPESTKKALLAQKERSPHEDIEHLLRPLPACLANPEAEDKESLVGARIMRPDEMAIETTRRRGSKNTIGQSVESSVDKDKRDKGIFAFTYSRPAELSDDQKKRLSKLTEIDAVVAEKPTHTKPKDKKGLWEWICSFLPEDMPG